MISIFKSLLQQKCKIIHVCPQNGVKLKNKNCIYSVSYKWTLFYFSFGPQFIMHLTEFKKNANKFWGSGPLYIQFIPIYKESY